MLNLFRLISAIFLIILIAPQKPKQNIVLRVLYSRRIFATYGETKRFLYNFSWFCIIFFLTLAFLSSLN